MLQTLDVLIKASWVTITSSLDDSQAAALGSTLALVYLTA